MIFNQILKDFERSDQISASCNSPLKRFLCSKCFLNDFNQILKVFERSDQISASCSKGFSTFLFKSQNNTAVEIENVTKT